MTNLQSTAPLNNISVVTPHDTNELDPVPRSIMVGVAGDLKITTQNGDTVTLVGLAAGIWHPISAKIVFSTGTAATDIAVGY